MSWFGWAASVKMCLLPRVLYLFQDIPIHLSPVFFSSLRTMIARFIWKGCVPRVQLSQLSLMKAMGDWSPRLRKIYYWASHLARTVDWQVNASTKQWVAIEWAFSPLPLEKLVWTNHSHSLPAIKTHPFISASLAVFKRANKACALMTSWSPLNPLHCNPDFPPGNHKTFLAGVWPDRGPRARDFYHDQKFKDLQDFPQSAKGMQIPRCTYFQLRYFLSMKEHKDYTRPLTSFETLFDSMSTHRPLISTLYSTLFKDHSAHADAAAREWERNWGCS